MGEGTLSGAPERLAGARRLVELLGDRGLDRTLRSGDFVHIEGDVAETLSVVLTGQMLATTYPPASWQPHPVAVIGPGALIGDDSLAPGGSRQTSIRCLTDTELVVVYRRDLCDLTRRDPSAHLLVLSLLSQRSRAVEGGVLAGAAASVEGRIVRWLLHLNETFDAGDRTSVRLAVTQEDLASLASTRRPTANRVLKALEGEGFIVVGRGHVTVCDPKGLVGWLTRDARTPSRRGFS